MTKLCHSRDPGPSTALTELLQHRLKSLFRSCLFHVVILLIAGTLLPLHGEEEKQHSKGEGVHSSALMRGERLFFGLVEGKLEGMACASCHNTVEIDTFNWNPNAWEIAHKYKDRELQAFTSAVLNPSGKTMSMAHQSFNLTEADVELIKNYLDHFEQTGLTKRKPVVNKIFLFLILGVILTWVLLDALFFKKVRPRFLLGIIFIGAFGWQVWLMVEAGTALGRQESYEPDQPVKFSHMVHATDNQIDCEYCHYTVDYSKSAGFPEVNLCMNCHILIREGTHSGKYEIDKVVEAHETGTPIAWVRVHNLQDHAFFSHAQHVAVGGMECQECHGAVETMDRVRQVSDLSMGWCINCHRESEVQFVDNAFYDTYEEVRKKLEAGEIDRVTADMTGANDCSKCHY